MKTNLKQSLSDKSSQYISDNNTAPEVVSNRLIAENKARALELLTAMIQRMEANTTVRTSTVIREINN